MIIIGLAIIDLGKNNIDSLVFFYLVGISGHFASTVYVTAYRRSRDNHYTLHICIRRISYTLFVQLDLSLLL